MESRILLAVEDKAAKEDVTQIQACMATVKNVCKTESKIAQLEYQLTKFIESTAINKEAYRTTMND